MNPKEKSNMLAVSVVVVNEDGRVLLRKRQKSPDEGKWELFASYPYLDEVPLEKAARRILKEKAGVDGALSITFSGKIYDAPDRHTGSVCVPLAFIARISQDVKVSDKLKWFSAAEIKDLPMALDNKRTLTDLGLMK